MQGFLVGTGRCLPERVVTNSELDGVLGTGGEWILKHTGIKTRRWVQGPEATSELAVGAARLAVERAGVGLDALDYLIAGTMTPEQQVPGIGSAPLHAERAEHVLIVGAEVQSKGLKLAPQAKEISALFGDGAGACVLSKSARPAGIELLDIALFTDADVTQRR
jgi:3-oxoacyl-[acyl-carrier-protein] synthase III